MQKKIKVAIIGPGNIGSDLMYKVKRSKVLEMGAMIGVVESEGIRRAAAEGYVTSTQGIRFLEENPQVADIVFDATSARIHEEIHAPILRKLGKIAIDLTPAAVGKKVAPTVNMKECLNELNVNLITCGGQATTPIVYAINTVVPIEYAEVVTTVSSKSAGPGTRQNIDEYTQTTSGALRELGGADRAKVMTIFNPAVPEIMMRNTIYAIPKADYKIEDIADAVEKMVARIQEFVPGYTLTLKPLVDKGIITTTVTVRGAGDFLPEYAGNLDIETAAAVKVAEQFAEVMLGGLEDELE